VLPPTDLELHIAGRAYRYRVTHRDRREGWMSPTKKRQTMGKVTRERELKERRALKQEKKDARKAAAAEERAADAAGGTLPATTDESEPDGLSNGV
jgi:hypothetical protein